MKFQLPWSPKPRTAPLEELREQLANARSSHAAAQAATEGAQTVFDDTGEASAEKALLAARSAEQSAAEHLGRAARLVEAAEGQGRAEERAHLQARRAELEAKTTLPALLAACDPDFRRAADALVAFADARVALAKRSVEFAALERELEGVAQALGEPRANGIVENADGTATMHSFSSHADLPSSPGGILMRLTPLLEGLPSAHPLHRTAQQLADAGPCFYSGPDTDA